MPPQPAPTVAESISVETAEAGAPVTEDAAVASEETAPPPIPPPPPKHEISGDAALVWVPDPKAARGLRSVLIERAGTKAKVVAERKEPVLVGAADLWVLREKKLISKACAECELCNGDPPRCQRNDKVVLQEPYLSSLRTGKTMEPWSSSFSPRDGCAQGIGDHTLDLALVGGVGNIYFVSIQSSDYYCGAAHPMFEDESLSFDIDTGKAVGLSFPKEVIPRLERDAKIELVDGCVMDEKDDVAPYRARAAYAKSGELVGVYELTMPAPYVCGSGPGHYSTLSEQTSDWIPPELAQFGKLPAWVASYLSSTDARYAFMLMPQRARAARREIVR